MRKMDTFSLRYKAMHKVALVSCLLIDNAGQPLDEDLRGRVVLVDGALQVAATTAIGQGRGRHPSIGKRRRRCVPGHVLVFVGHLHFYPFYVLSIFSHFDIFLF